MNPGTAVAIRVNHSFECDFGVRPALPVRTHHPTVRRVMLKEEVSFGRVYTQDEIVPLCLESGKATVKETTRLVGFSDPSAFSRAFKRWTGSSPSAYQSRLTIR